jgi:hypothetical protein
VVDRCATIGLDVGATAWWEIRVAERQVGVDRVLGFLGAAALMAAAVIIGVSASTIYSEVPTSVFDFAQA